MNKKVVRLGILGIVFIGALITFSKWVNKENKEMVTTMEESVFPVIHFVYEGVNINEIHGYVDKMDLGTMRDAVTPIDSDNRLTMEITSSEGQVEQISYEIRDVKDNHLLVDEDDMEYVEEGENIVCEISLPNLFEQNQEYNMVISLDTSDGELYYYTRLIDPDKCYLEESLDFALQFHEYTFRDDADTFIPTYMDPATGDATTLNYVDLSCTLNQITWADFEGTRLTDPIASVEEVNASYNVILLKYVVTSVNDNREVEYYNVEEYYRLRKAPNRMYVLNFERRMNQIFRTENTFIRGDSSLILGIRDSEIEFKANEAGDSIAFVQEGELWSYNRTNNTISKVFSFRGAEGINIKENWDQHDIQIMKVDEAGSVDFAVYGYMNRGVHEGKVGIGIYHYDGISHSVEEEIFISSTKSFEALKAELGDLFYVNEQKLLYLILNETFYEINLTDYKIKVILENLEAYEYAVSKSNRYIAWIDCKDGENSHAICLQDLKTGIDYEIKEDENTYLRPLGFLGEDFIYGMAKKEDVKSDVTGRVQFPMSSLKIMDTYEANKEVIKTYRPTSGYIKGITLEDNNIYVDLMLDQGDYYESIGQDIIMNRVVDNVGDVAISTMVTQKKQKQMLLSMKPLSSSYPLTSTVSEFILKEEEQQVISLDDFSKQMYYVYAKGASVFASRNIWEAILTANANLGVVVNQDRDYIWERARSTKRSPLSGLSYHETDASGNSVTKCVSTILMAEGKGIHVGELIATGQSPKDIIERTLYDVSVYELFECKTDELLYFIDQGTPVMAYVEHGNAILLTGYSSDQLYYYDPVTQTEGAFTKEIGDARFAQGGLHYLVYLK